MSIQWVNMCSFKPKNVALVDGTVVANDSEAWRAECEARSVLAIPTKGGRYNYLNKVQERRGKEARDRLHDEVMRVWHLSRWSGIQVDNSGCEYARNEGQSREAPQYG